MAEQKSSTLNRRDLLKYFSIGTIIAPLSSSPPVAAELIEVPAIRPVELPTIVVPLQLQDVVSGRLELTTKDGSKRRILLENVWCRQDRLLSSGEEIYGEIAIQKILTDFSPESSERLGTLFVRGKLE